MTAEEEAMETTSASSAGVAPADLRAELERFEHDLRAGGLRESTVHSYLMGSSLFVRWLAGEYVPGPGRTERKPRRRVGSGRP